MSLFPSDTAREVWREHWCALCWHPDEVSRREYGMGLGCPILARAVTRDRKPVEWTRNTRATTMAGAYSCDMFLRQPAVARRKTAPCETLALFEVEPAEETPLVPVEGWPEAQAFKPAKKSRGDHA